MELVAVDIGGTNARFALASLTADGRIALEEPVTLGTSDFASLQTAWEEFERRIGRQAPRAAAIAIAGPVNGGTVRMTNNSWVLHTGALDEQLGIDRVTVINDFGAVAHAVARADADQFVHLCGPEGPLPTSGTTSVIGPGTGLGVAHLLRLPPNRYHVQATEGGHVDFAPMDHIDDLILQRLRARHRRVSVERVVAGPGIAEIYQTLATMEKREPRELDDRAIWTSALDRSDSLAAAALDRFCLSLGSAAGDYALAHGSNAVVIAGGIGLRLRSILPRSGFGDRFRFKGRYEQMMAGIPVRLIVHPQPGLFGAVAAFQAQHAATHTGQQEQAV